MNNNLFKKLFFLFTLSFFLCNCVEEETTAPTEENLLINTSFEKNGQASSDGWTIPSGSNFSSDVPPDGGAYSLELMANAPPDFAFIKVPVKTQYTINKLTFWAKSGGVTSNIYGEAILTQVRNGAEIKSRSILVDEIVWRSFTIQDTFNVADGDSFLVQFSGGISQLLSAKSYFDRCQLQGIK